MASFVGFFRSPDPARDKFLSRFFALFSESVVRTWCAVPQAPYEDLGRPTLCKPGSTRGHTIDFTLRDRSSGRCYVVELKCELEYDGYRYLTLTAADQLNHHTSPAFAKFLTAARHPSVVDVRVRGTSQQIHGAVLIWGAMTAEGRQATMETHGFADVLSVEQMLADLHTWQPESWLALVNRYRGWTDELFDFLAGAKAPDTSQPTLGKENIR